MRLDKYLKVSRIIKRRTVAKELSDHQRIKVNGKIVKPSYEVKFGDVIAIRFGQRLITVEVTSISEHATKADATSLYQLISDEKIGE